MKPFYISRRKTYRPGARFHTSTKSFIQGICWRSLAVALESDEKLLVAEMLPRRTL